MGEPDGLSSGYLSRDRWVPKDVERRDLTPEERPQSVQSSQSSITGESPGVDCYLSSTIYGIEERGDLFLRRKVYHEFVVEIPEMATIL